MTRQGQSQRVSVRLFDYVIRNRQQISIPATGMLFVQVQSGTDIDVVIDGRRERKHDEGAFVVQQGASLTVETENETAVLTILALPSR